MKLKDQVAIVTGSAQGIGRAIAIGLAREGSHVVIADIQLDKARGVADEIKALGKEDILEMLGIELGPVRLKCALLSLKVLKAGVYGIEELEEELT